MIKLSKLQLLSILLLISFSNFDIYGQTHTKREYGTHEAVYGFYEYLPAGYAGSDNWPVIIVLADEAQKGNGIDNLDLVLNAGIAKLIQGGNNYEFVIITVQTPTFWATGNINLMLEYIKDNYKVDNKRIYLTGYGEWGGTATWSYASTYPEKLGAIVPIDGISGGVSDACGIKYLAIWNFFGAANNRRFSSVGTIEDILACDPPANPAPKQTLYSGLSTESSSRTYDGSGGHDIFSWMLENSSDNFPNLSPEADAGFDQYITLPENTITLEGSASDNDGEVVSYSWKKTSGSDVTIDNPNNATATVTGLVQGNYVFELSATDEDGGVGIDEVLITVVATDKSMDCAECDFVIEANNQTINTDLISNLTPGMKICIRGGVRDWLFFFDIIGTEEEPITITNCGGQVFIYNDNRNGIVSFDNCQNFRFTGTGDSDFFYGIKVARGGIDTAIRLGSGSRDFEFDHIEVAHAGFAGIMLKSDPVCARPENWRENYKMANLNVHDNYVHDVFGEGFYIGHYAYEGLVTTECGTIYPHLIENLNLHHNITENTGADGIQVACNPEGTWIHDNIILNYGTDPFADFQDNGLIVGQKSIVNNNFIANGKGKGAGMQLFGAGGHLVFNNVIINSPYSGIFSDERTTEKQGDFYYIVNNTIVNSGSGGIRVYASRQTNFIKNNIIVDVNGDYIIPLNSETIVDKSNNLELTSIDDAGFVNPNTNNYQLLESSPAVDAGIDLSNIGVITDYLGGTRPTQDGYDIGAYEYGSVITALDEENVVNDEFISTRIYPNPVNPISDILKLDISISKSTRLKVYIMDVLGNHVKEILDVKKYTSGSEFKIEWDLKNSSNQPIKQGMYFVIFESDSYNISRKVLIH